MGARVFRSPLLPQLFYHCIAVLLISTKIDHLIPTDAILAVGDSTFSFNAGSAIIVIV